MGIPEIQQLESYLYSLTQPEPGVYEVMLRVPLKWVYFHTDYITVRAQPRGNYNVFQIQGTEMTDLRELLDFAHGIVERNKTIDAQRQALEEIRRKAEEEHDAKLKQLLEGCEAPVITPAPVYQQPVVVPMPMPAVTVDAQGHYLTQPSTPDPRLAPAYYPPVPPAAPEPPRQEERVKFGFNDMPLDWGLSGHTEEVYSDSGARPDDGGFDHAPDLNELLRNL